MDFKEFAHRLRPIIGDGKSTSAFARTLFESIVSEKGREILDECPDADFKSYFNGHCSINGLAQKIMLYIEKMLFAKYMYEFDDPLAEKLCNAFEGDIADITPHNFGDKLAELFDGIILKAASTTRKPGDKKQKDSENKITDSEVVDEGTAENNSDNGKNITVIQQQTNVIQNGENNYNLTNNGTMNFNF